MTVFCRIGDLFPRRRQDPRERPVHGGWVDRLLNRVIVLPAADVLLTPREFFLFPEGSDLFSLNFSLCRPAIIPQADVSSASGRGGAPPSPYAGRRPGGLRFFSRGRLKSGLLSSRIGGRMAPFRSSPDFFTLIFSTSTGGHPLSPGAGGSDRNHRRAAI